MATGLGQQNAGWISTLLTPFTQYTMYATVRGHLGCELLSLAHRVLPLTLPLQLYPGLSAVLCTLYRQPASRGYCPSWATTYHSAFLLLLHLNKAFFFAQPALVILLFGSVLSLEVFLYPLHPPFLLPAAPGSHPHWALTVLDCRVCTHNCLNAAPLGRSTSVIWVACSSPEPYNRGRQEWN